MTTSASTPRAAASGNPGGDPSYNRVQNAPSTASSPAASSSRRILDWLMNNGALVGLIVLCVALFIATPHFLTVPNLLNVGIQAATVAILAFGMTFVIVTAGIDLSVGSVAAFAAMVSAYSFSNLGLPGWVTIIVGLGIGLLAGVISGAAVAYGKLPAFIATLAMMSIARGATLVVSDGSPIPSAPAVNWMGATSAGLPIPIAMMALAGLLCWFILSRTVLGRSMYAIGGNEEAARLCGLPVKRILVSVYALSGLFAGLAGLVMTGRLASAQPQAAYGYELDAIAAVVIGGASLSGGSGKATGTLIGAVLLAVIRNGLNLMSVSSFWQQIVIGCVIALAVGFDVIRTKTERA